ncbi:EAL domain-containing protein [Roseibium porphyridii]|uniref:EAL domain-containing protein n=1 Tax=Roseibium porphyridii TaxID=2866279 RepID=A0ABY8F3F6_9HYPH|nr:EAL domain-containing protein [Roseibium sp. KMA01]WFE87860.1 EAL domain-containing protein [Roseibium sp. KMA01]
MGRGAIALRLEMSLRIVGGDNGKMWSDRTKRFGNACVIAILVVAATAFVRYAGFSGSIDRFLWEAKFSHDKRPVTGQIVLIDIDAKSLNELGVWPLPRRLYAELTDFVAGSGASDILFDIDFSAVSSAEDDRLFANSIESAGNVSLAMFRQAASAGTNQSEVINKPIDKFLEAAWPVVVMVPVENDSRIWRNIYGYDISGTSELSASAFLGEYSGEALGAFGLDFGISIDELPTVSLVDVLDRSVDPEFFLGKKVVVGASAQELRDLFPVPVYGILPGSVIQALGAESLLQNRAMRIEGELAALAFAVVVFLLLLMTKIEGWAVKALILALAAGAIELAAFLLQKHMPLLVPTASAQFLLLFAATGIVLRELGFHRLISHVATIGKHNSERMLGLVFEDSFDAIVVIQKDGCVSAASRSARLLFHRKKLIGSKAHEVLPSELVEEAQEVLLSTVDQMPISKTLAMPFDNGDLRYIEYVVTRSERTLAGNSGDDTSEAVACLTCRDVTEERESALRLEYLAKYDPITGLLNRNGFEEELTMQALLVESRGENLGLLQFAVVNLDQIVASLGFSFGDSVRKTIATRLKTHLSDGVTWSALSSDTFAAAFANNPRGDDETRLIERIRDLIGEDYSIDGARISVQLKFGYAVCDAAEPPETQLKRSGNALARVRRDIQQEVLAFDPGMDAALMRRRELETELFKAIVRDELQMAYQPLVTLDDGLMYGVEALLRWEHRELGPISPAEFVPIAEENGYIVELGAWALNRAMKECLSWPLPVRLSINLSAIQFSRGNLVATVQEALQRTGFPAERLDLEITESLFIEEGLDLRFLMEEIRSFGCSFSLDDFGTGYSSLSYLPNYPFSKIKLDRAFIRETLSDKKDVSLIEAVLHLVKGHDMELIVEGIETPEQAAKLKQLGCQLGQGYLFGKPMNAIELASMLSKAA